MIHRRDSGELKARVSSGQCRPFELRLLHQRGHERILFDMRIDYHSQYGERY